MHQENRHLTEWTTLIVVVFGAVIGSVLLAGSSQAGIAAPTPVITAMADKPTETPTVAPTAPPTSTPLPTATPAPTLTFTPSPTPEPTGTPLPPAVPTSAGVVLESTPLPPGEPAPTAQLETAGIDAGALYHDSRDSLYRTPGGAVPFNTTVTLRLRAAAGSLDAAAVRVYSTRDESQTLVPMQIAAATPQGYELWEAQIPAGGKTTVLWYRFIVTRGQQTLYYEDDTRLNDENRTFVAAREGGAGTVYTDSPDLSFQITVYDPAYYTPAWMRDAIIYQIFPDRFRNGDRSNDPQDGAETFYGELPLVFHATWNEPMLDGRVDKLPNGGGHWNSDFYGGDLAGITEKLDYLADLGVTAIYLNPIFEARSNHRYDTVDYLKIDPFLGTLEDFETLVSEAEQRGIKLILDGVFNHMSSESPYFDRYDRYPGKQGACESIDSPYRKWFFFAPPKANQPAPCAGDPNPLYYQSWFGFDTIPRINNAIIETRRFFFLDEDSVAQTWGRAGIGGWRMDVAPDIDNGRDPQNIYWETFRAVVRRLNPETAIISEEWGDAAEMLQGDEFDSTMNYRLRTAILGFARDTDFTDNDTNGDRTIRVLTARGFDDMVRAIEEDYPRPAYLALMNLLGSHDTSRLLFAADNDKQVQRLAALAQFTLPGAPTVYYGDEIALDAPSQDDNGVFQDDPYNRAPYPWPDETGDHYPPPDEDMLAFYQTLGRLRRDHPALRQGEMHTLLAEEPSDVYVFARLDREAGDAALVALNRGRQAQTVTLDLAGRLPAGLTLAAAFGGATLTTGAGPVTLELPAKAGDAWTAAGDPAIFAAPEPPSDVTADGGNAQAVIAWEPVADAAGYLVYRSPVAEGGFQPLFSQPITATTYTDAAAANGFVYYYAVASVSASGMVGALSPSARAVPAFALDDAFYAGETTELREVELAYGVTVELAAGVRAAGVTGGAAAAPGILAQAALIPAGTPLDEAGWQPMAYTGPQDGADLYRIVFTPQATGTFQMVARFSPDAGQTWTTAALPTGMQPTLTVLASSDTTPPDAPAAVQVARASLSGVRLEWEPVEDDNLFAYRVYRAAGAADAQLVAEVSAGGDTAFTDTAVAEGATYTYSVAAVDGSLNESAQTAAEPVTIARLVVPVVFTVEVPDYTNSTLFIAGAFGSDFPTWDPAGLAMSQVDDTHWTITLELKEGARLEYKYVRGDWIAVEKGPECEEISNRRLTVMAGEDGTQTVTDRVAKWRDLDACP